MYFQPVKSDSPSPIFYNMYKRETAEYDTEYMQKHDEDLNTTLIFVRFLHSRYHCTMPTTFLGRSVHCGQVRLHHRRPVGPLARLQRTIRSTLPRDSPQSQPIHCPQRRPCRSASVECPPPRSS